MSSGGSPPLGGTLSDTMRCPLCATEDTRVIDSRPAEGGGAIRRRRECLVCGERFTTFERPMIVATVVKRSGRREAFDREKVRRGLEFALADRPVPDDTVDDIVTRIEASARGGSALVTSDELGRAVLAELRDLDEEEPLEVEASKFDLNYIKLDGNIGCMVNGAGLAMATMDIIKHCGGEPANFLDVGGDASQERVAAAFRILLSDSAVKGVLVNIFGGIVRCDMVARGVVAAAEEVKLSIPLVVRLEGTNVEEGRRVLAESDLAVIVGEGMADAAEKVVAAVGGAS